MKTVLRPYQSRHARTSNRDIRPLIVAVTVLTAVGTGMALAHPGTGTGALVTDRIAHKTSASVTPLAVPHPYPALGHPAAAHPVKTTAPKTLSASWSATQAPADPSPARTAAVTVPAASGTLGGRLLATAETMAGVPYVWAGVAPGGFDCSGLVVWAAGKLGIVLPRSTYGMLAGSPHLTWVSSPHPGDLAFFGSGHVELYVHKGETFGAQQPGTVVGFHSYGFGYVPTEFLRLSQ